MKVIKVLIISLILGYCFGCYNMNMEPEPSAWEKAKEAKKHKDYDYYVKFVERPWDATWDEFQEIIKKEREWLDEKYETFAVRYELVKRLAEPAFRGLAIIYYRDKESQ